MFGLLNSASAMSAAFFIDCAATPALPPADSGRIKPTLTCPLPSVAAGCGAVAGADCQGMLNSPSEPPEQAPSRPAMHPNPAASKTRRDGCNRGGMADLLKGARQRR